MASLRTSFVQTCSFNNNPLFSYLNGAVINFNSLFNNEDKDQTKNISKQQEATSTKKCKSQTYFKAKQNFSNQFQRSLGSFINLHINSFHQLADIQNSDFKGHENFVHVLELQTEQQMQQKLMQSLETVQSLNLEDNGFLQLHSPHSTRNSTLAQESSQELSEVEEIFY